MLQVLPPFVFSDMLNLQELNLEENEIYSLSTQAFSGLQNLLRLDIKNNNFTRLEYGIFNDLSSLFSLDVSNCQLEVSKLKYFCWLNVQISKYLEDTSVYVNNYTLVKLLER